MTWGARTGFGSTAQRVRKEARFRTDDTVTIGDLDYVVKSVKTPEPERRLNRDHHQDARSAGATPLREEQAGHLNNAFSQEIPVAIPEDEEAFEEVDSDTPDSFPVISKREGAEPADLDRSAELAPGRTARQPRRVSDSDAHLPVTE